MSQHYATTKLLNTTFQVSIGEILVAKSNQVIELTEHNNGKDYPAVLYFPKDSIDWEKFVKSETSTFCPIKGEANYLSFSENDLKIQDALWFYPSPLEGVAQIKDHYAFYLSKGFELKQI